MNFTISYITINTKYVFVIIMHCSVMFSREFTPVFSQNLSVGNKKMYTEIFPISTKQNYLMFQIPISEIFCVDFFFIIDV